MRRGFRRATLSLVKDQSNNIFSWKDFNIDDIEINQIMEKPFKDNHHMFGCIMIQYGYIVLFAVACPLGSTLAIIMNMIEIRMRIYGYLYVYQRPIVKTAKDIGPWKGIIQFISFMAIGTNLALLY